MSASLRSLSRLLLWPIFVAGSLISFAAIRIKPNKGRTKPLVDYDLSDLEAKFENVLGMDGDAIRAFDFRDKFIRYTGLAAAGSARFDRVSVAEVFEVSRHPQADMASACLARRNGRRLNEKLDVARIEFANVLLSGSISKATELTRLSHRLADFVSDTQLKQLIPEISAPIAAASNPQVPDEYWIERSNA